MTHDNEYPTDLSFSNARATTFTLFSSGPHLPTSSRMSIYLCSFYTYLPDAIRPLINVSLAAAAFGIRHLVASR